MCAAACDVTCAAESQGMRRAYGMLHPSSIPDATNGCITERTFVVQSWML